MDRRVQQRRKRNIDTVRMGVLIAVRIICRGWRRHRILDLKSVHQRVVSRVLIRTGINIMGLLVITMITYHSHNLLKRHVHRDIRIKVETASLLIYPLLNGRQTVIVPENVTAIPGSIIRAIPIVYRMAAVLVRRFRRGFPNRRATISSPAPIAAGKASPPSKTRTARSRSRSRLPTRTVKPPVKRPSSSGRRVPTVWPKSRANPRVIYRVRAP